jgi:hypothetical protein
LIPNFNRALPDILAAERALGRLDQLLDDQAVCQRSQADASRRDALASARLDGLLVHKQDFMVATAGMGFAPPSGGQALNHANATWQLAETLRRQSSIALAGADSLMPGKPVTEEASSYVSDAWKAVADVEALLAGTPDDESEETCTVSEEDDSEHLAPCHAEPWTAEWVIEHFLYWQSLVSGRSRDSLEAAVPESSTIQGVLDAIETTLVQFPGLPGAYQALYQMHNSEDFQIQVLGQVTVDERERDLRRMVMERGVPSWIWMFARLITPLLIQRSCRVHHAWVPFSPQASLDGNGYRMFACGSESGWITWVSRLMRDSIENEIRRAGELKRLEEEWRDRVGPRRKNSSMPEVFTLLFQHPAFTVRQMEHRLSLTFRGAQLIVSDLDKAGIVRDVTSRALDRVFVARDLIV